jgi:hypothetical protein
MKNYISLAALNIVFNLLVQSAYSQCTEKKDEFTGETKISSELQKLGTFVIKDCPACQIYDLSFSLIDMKEISGYFSLFLIPEFMSVQTIKKGEILYIKFENDSLLQLPIGTKSSVSNYKQAPNKTVLWYNSVGCVLTPEQATMLEQNKIKKVRLLEYVYEVDSKNSEVVQKAIACIREKKSKK